MNNTKIAIFILQLPFLLELIRRFIFPSAMVLAIIDVFVYIFFMKAISAGSIKNSEFYKNILISIVVYGMFSTFLTHKSLYLMYVGIRPLVLMVMYYSISEYIFIRANRSDFKRFYYFFIFWQIFIASLSFAQLLLGSENPINFLPEGASDDLNSVVKYEDSDIFRPSSIFLFAGKYGQVAFFMATLPIVFVIGGIKNKLIYTLLIFGIIGLFISGQKAGIISFLIISLMAIVYFKNYKILIPITYIGIIILLSLLFVPAVLKEDFSYIIFDKIIEGFSIISSRSDDNFFSVYRPILNNLSLMGTGVGGLQYSVMDISSFFIEIENSTLRIIAEWGFIGYSVYVASVLYLIFGKKYLYSRNLNKNNLTMYAKILNFATLAIFILLLFWSNTHDVFGNYLSCIILASIAGAASGFTLRDQR